MNIRVDLNYPIKDGTEVVFRSPVDCSAVTGLKVYYIGDDGNARSKEFMLADAHGNNVGIIDHLFAENVAVKVILDVTTSMAFVQNADTNAYLEGRFAQLEKAIAGCGGGASPLIVTVTDGKASHTNTEIYEHIQSDGVAYVLYDDVLYPLSASENTATASCVTDEGFVYYLEIYDGRFIKVEYYFAKDEQISELEEQIGDIDTALDNIIAIQNSLIGGDA